MMCAVKTQCIDLMTDLRTVLFSFVVVVHVVFDGLYKDTWLGMA